MPDHDSTVQDLNHPDANMYGFFPCPKCGSKYRCEFQGNVGTVECDDCGYHEKITERRGD